MTAYAEGSVAEVLEERGGLTRVRLEDGARAYALTQLTGPVGPGDRVVLNTTAVDRSLGSGGWHVIHWNLSRPPFVEEGPGHLMKLRYTSVQVDSGAGTEEHPDLPDRIDGVPVIGAGLHSQLPVIAAAIARARPGTRVAYVMTDGGALPMALSDAVVNLLDRDLIHGTVSAGHAFGGQVEALNVPSGLALARHLLDAEAIIVAMGPGVAGTGSRLGFTGLEVASVLDSAAWLGGIPIHCLRCSDGDARERHRGVSHHSRTVLDAVRSRVSVPTPPGLDPTDGRHEWTEVEVGDVAGMLADADLRVTTMGRGIEEDPLFFAAAAAAGTFAARLLEAETGSGTP